MPYQAIPSVSALCSAGANPKIGSDERGGITLKLKYDWDFEHPPVPEGEEWDSSRDFFLSSGGGEGNEAQAEIYNRRGGAG